MGARISWPSATHSRTIGPGSHRTQFAPKTTGPEPPNQLALPRPPYATKGSRPSYCSPSQEFAGSLEYRREDLGTVLWSLAPRIATSAFLPAPRGTAAVGMAPT